MNSLEKFYSDGLKLIKSCDSEKFAVELAELFNKAIYSFDKHISGLAKNLADYKLANLLSGEIDKTECVEWFYKLFSLFAGSFDKNMDFSEEDWNEIKLTISAEAEELDMDFLNEIMTVFVERKKI